MEISRVQQMSFQFYLSKAVFWSCMSDVMSSSGHGDWPHAADSSKAQLAQSTCSVIQRIARQNPEGHADPQAAFPAQSIMRNTNTHVLHLQTDTFVLKTIQLSQAV